MSGTPFLKYGPKHANVKVETVEEFLARGGQITKNEAQKVDAQRLLDAVAGTDDEAEMIAFLKSQGIEVA